MDTRGVVADVVVGFGDYGGSHTMKPVETDLGIRCKRMQKSRIKNRKRESSKTKRLRGKKGEKRRERLRKK